MKTVKKLLAVTLALAMCCGMLTACGGNDAKNNGKTEKNETLVVSVENGLEGKFSPFFAASGDDTDITDMTQMYLMIVDRVSNPVLKGIEGETRAYNGTDYTYYGPADIEITENEDGTVSYDVTMREDLAFSDGTPVDIDDVIFTLYVYLVTSLPLYGERLSPCSFCISL